MEDKFVRVRGLRIYYIESGGIGAPKLLLIHGLGRSSNTWERVFGDLSENFHVIAVDLPGFGKSDKPPSPCGVDDLAEFMCHFVESTNFYPAILVGHSMGAMISIKIYGKCPEKVGGIVLIDAAGMSDTPAKMIKEYMGERWDLERLRKYHLECVLGRLGKLDEARLREFMQMFDDPAFSRIYISLLNSISKPLSPTDLAEIKVPTLIIWGSDDKVTPLEDGIKMSQVIAGSRLVVIDGAGHSPHSEAPEQVVSVIKDFVSKLKNG